MSTEKGKFRVIIVGGSIAGLTLAHCLRNSGIDFVVLEAYHDIAPVVGASVGINANGARILDQMGIYDDVLDLVEPLTETAYWGDNANLLAKSGGAIELHKRHAYPIAFLDRQDFLKVLYAHLKDDQERVLTEKRLIQVDHHSTHVVAHCKDGSSYTGDLIVGADGIHSTVRQLMWNHLDSKGLSKEAEVERKTMTSEFDCVYGISEKIPELLPGDNNRTFAEGYSLLVISSQEGRLYWFLFTKMDRKYLSHEIPRFDQKNVDNHVSRWLDKPVTDTVSFRDVYERAIITKHVPLEEADYKHWCTDRWACVGDSIHKMTPNAGQGANSAIESAASLTNYLAGLLEDKPTPTTEDIDVCLHTWQAERQQRSSQILKMANDLTRLEACETWKYKLVALHLLPYLSALMINRLTAAMIGSERLKSLPLPARSLLATVPFTDSVEAKQESSLSRRGLTYLPLLVGIGAVLGTSLTFGSRSAFAAGGWKELIRRLSL